MRNNEYAHYDSTNVRDQTINAESTNYTLGVPCAIKRVLKTSRGWQITIAVAPAAQPLRKLTAAIINITMENIDDKTMST